jgi:hypothetical protein
MTRSQFEVLAPLALALSAIPGCYGIKRSTRPSPTRSRKAKRKRQLSKDSRKRNR